MSSLRNTPTTASTHKPSSIPNHFFLLTLALILQSTILTYLLYTIIFPTLHLSSITKSSGAHPIHDLPARSASYVNGLHDRAQKQVHSSFHPHIDGLRCIELLSDVSDNSLNVPDLLARNPLPTFLATSYKVTLALPPPHPALNHECNRSRSRRNTKRIVAKETERSWKRKNISNCTLPVNVVKWSTECGVSNCLCLLERAHEAMKALVETGCGTVSIKNPSSDASLIYGLNVPLFRGCLTAENVRES